MQGKPVAEQEIGKQLLLETAAYAESSVCRRKTLLHYFGEEYTEENCGNCDNCLNPKKQVEAQELLCTVIETVLAVKENFKADYIIDIIQGKETSEVQAHLHEDLEVFGSGMGEEDKTWNAVIRQALIAGYLTKEVENYGLLKVTDAGKKFLKHPKSFKITEDNDFEEVEEEAPARGGGACAVDPALYSMLKDLRKKLSKKLEVPPYVIFQDPSLEAMATIYPITLDELQNIPGVGAGKAKRYGEEFCKLIKRHCEENEIERPEDLRVRTVANKSKMKVAIIQAIDRKVALDDIAMSKGIEFEELLDEIEAIVYSGTKLNIDYFLEDIMDEDHLLDIYDYFKESTTDNIDDALDELGDDFTCSWQHNQKKCGNYSTVCDCYNKEHSVPQSWFSSKSPMVSDAFHVYPTDGKVNGQRSNYPFGECTGGKTLTADALGRLGTSTFSGFSGTVFEPVDDYKGDFARTYFYMATRYANQCESWGNHFSTANNG
jgi:ATP-dependent DNA helicase RecQ